MTNEDTQVPSNAQIKPAEMLAYDFSQETLNTGESFSQCVDVALGVSVCTKVDPETYVCVTELELAGVKLAEAQFALGRPCSMEFILPGSGEAILSGALFINDEGRHYLQYHMMVTGELGIKVLDRTITVGLPF